MATQIYEGTPLFARPDIVAQPDPEIEGGLILHSREPLGGYPATVIHSLRAWAAADPEHPLVAERIPRTPVGWRVVTYGESADADYRVAQVVTSGMETSLTIGTDLDLTLRVPGPERVFLINPFGLHYQEVTASNLVAVDTEGSPVRPGQR